ncbi:MAG: L-serine ammonia-lyase, iron-sulfur-dependent, subunit alpha [Spirochaetaceae bacterium]|jgi:L-serine dehydratase|nr:L-serine ammonia-lyase, iron-sulfur-dependent, subunit alpha [Spirochaetaceae bacterium]
MLEYHSVAALAEAAEKQGCAISELVISDQAAFMGRSREELYASMKDKLDVMRKSAAAGNDETRTSSSGLSGGDGFKMDRYARSGGVSGASGASGAPAPISGGFCAAAMARALAIGECNAGMGRIVAAPTAGSCGILPAALLTMEEFYGVREEALVMALFTAGAVGLVIAREASISGAEGGCQAECGSAAALAAAALVELRGGAPTQAAHAVAIAIKNQLGLVCDPVAGLVEVPCVKRNAGSVMCAIAAADMALAGVTSVIPVDEVISAMREVGEALPSSLRETAQGGLAATPTGILLKQKIFG